MSKCSGGGVTLTWVQCKYRQKSQWIMNRHLSNEGHEWNTGHARGEVTNGRGRAKEGSKENKYGWCIFFIRTNIDFLSLLKSP
jgi:hypothetical protein